jgi:hypothetical protein
MAMFLSLSAMVMFAFFTTPRVQADDSTGGSTSGATTTQPAGFTVTLTVTDAAGKPVANAHVTLTVAAAKGAKAGAAAAATTPKVKGAGKAAKNGAAAPVALGDTDGNGVVVLKNVPTGSYSAAVTTPDGATGKKKVAVTGTNLAVKIKLKAAANTPATQPA